jgi:hypothetical protein
MAEKGSDGRLKQAGQWDQVKANEVFDTVVAGTEAETVARTEPAQEEPGQYSDDATKDETLP